MDDEQETTGLMSQSFFGVPVIVWVIGIGIIAYLLISRKSSSSTPGTSSGGGGTISTGRTTIQRGAVQITVDGGPQPKPPVRKKKKKTTKGSDLTDASPRTTEQTAPEDDMGVGGSAVSTPSSTHIQARKDRRGVQDDSRADSAGYDA